MEEVCTLLHFQQTKTIFTMKKIYILLIILAFFGNLSSQNNNQLPYVSELFNYTFSKHIKANLNAEVSKNVSAIYESTLFVINKQGFKNQTTQGCAKISKINVFSGIEESYFITPSPSYLESGEIPEHIWIWALAANDSIICIAVDEEVWVYHYTISKQYEYSKTIPIKDVSQIEMIDNMLHLFVNTDDGFNWMTVNLFNDEIKNVRQLVLKHRFFLQISPVKVIAISNNALYLLQQNEPAIEKYSLTGELLASYLLKIPNWENIPDNITQQLDSIENKTERAYAFSKVSIFDYNMMHLFYVFPCERFFLIAIDKKNEEEMWMKPYFIQIIGDTAMIDPYSVKLHENDAFGKINFPFLIPYAEGNLIFAEFKEYITQINRTTPVSWQNKTQKEFKHEVNLFYKDNDPIEKVETFLFTKNYISVDSIVFLDYDDNFFFLKDIEKDKAIFIISQYPQCSGCAKVIWSYFSKKLMPNVELYTITVDCPTYLMKKDNLKEINTFLKAKYTPLFINTKDLNEATKHIFSQRTNPIVVLFDKKLQHIEVTSSEHIIENLMGNLKPTFLHTIENFVEN